MHVRQYVHLTINYTRHTTRTMLSLRKILKCVYVKKSQISYFMLNIIKVTLIYFYSNLSQVKTTLINLLLFKYVNTMMSDNI